MYYERGTREMNDRWSVLSGEMKGFLVVVRNDSELAGATVMGFWAVQYHCFSPPFFLPMSKLVGL